jgi:hypothetical protein
MNSFGKSFWRWVSQKRIYDRFQDAFSATHPLDRLKKILFGERFPIISGKSGIRSTHAVIAVEYTGPEAISGGVVISYTGYLHDQGKTD